MKLFILHTKNSFFFVLSFLVLCSVLPAQIQAQATAKWPLKVRGDKQDTVQKIFCGYGNYDDNTIGTEIHFHEGIDLIADEGTVVFASEDGTIVDLNDKAPHYSNYMFVTRGTNTEEILAYLHMKPKGGLISGAAVKTGDTLGTIAKNTAVAIDPHLHFGWHNKASGSWALVPDENGNPIEVLFNRSDNSKPTFDAVRYRPQSEEDKPAATYFTEKTASNDTVVKEAVDIISRIGEKFNNFTGTNYTLNVTRIQFSAREFAPGNVAQVPIQQPITFLGKFLADCNPNKTRNTHLKHFDASLVHNWYENDNTCKSVPRALTGPDKGSYWYIVTNKDTTGDNLTDNSRNFSWYTKSKAVAGVKWNNLYRDAAHVADSNNTAEYPDGRYIVTLKAFGYGHPLIDFTTHTDTMFINNHNEYIYSCDATGKLKDVYCTGQPVYITGKGYPKNRRIPVWLFKDANWNDGDTLNIRNPKFMFRIIVMTDANGRIPPTLLWNAYEPNGDPDQGYDIIVDYDDDVLYTTPKEGKTVDILDAAPGPYSIIGKKLIIEKSYSDVTCRGKCNGTISITVRNGTPPYNYYWSDLGVWNTEAQRDSLCAGTLVVTVEDAEGCTISDTTIIREPAGLVLNCSGTPAYCDSCNGTATMVAGGGRPPYTYSWPGGRLTGLCAGTYKGYVTDSSGCTDSCTVTIYHGYSTLSVSCSGTPATCDSCNGTATISASGGVPPYTYSWPGGRRTGLCPGTYTGYVTDSLGCTDSCTVTIYRSNSTLTAYCTGSAATCDSCNGSATISAYGGVPPYTYSWPGGRLTGLCPGTYTGTVRDAAGCTASCTATVYSGISTLTAYCTGSAATCDSCNGTATISASGGVPPYTYSWPGGRLTRLCPGTYTGTVTDAAGCRSSCTVTIGRIGRIVMGTQGLFPVPIRICDTIIVDTVIVDTIIHVDITQPNPINGLPNQVSINRAYPNPFTSQANIEFTSSSAGDGQVLVQNVTGSLVQQYTIKTQKGKNITRIDGTNLPPGIYFIKITTSNSVAIKLYRR